MDIALLIALASVSLLILLSIALFFKKTTEQKGTYSSICLQEKRVK